MGSEQNLRIVSSLARLEDATLEWLAPRLRRIPFKKGETLFVEETPFTACYFVIEGFIKILKDDSSGSRVFISLSGPNDTLGEFAIFNHNKYPVTTLAATNGRA